MNSDVLTFLLNAVVAGGGAAVVAFLAFKFLGKSLVNNWFERRQEDYRQERAEELQRYKAEIDTLLSGALKMQELEHRVLPEIWVLLVDADTRLHELACPLFDDKDLDSMTASELEEFFNSTRLSHAQKEKIRESDKKLDAYRVELYPTRVREAEKACRALQELTLKNKIFLAPEVMSAFEDILGKMWDIVTTYNAGLSVAGYLTADLKHQLWDQQRAISKEIHLLGSTIHSRFVEKGAIRS